MEEVKKPFFAIFGEENGALASNAYEWSHGNGAVGAGVGVVIPVDCQLEHVTFNSENGLGSVQIRIERNGTTVYTATFTSRNQSINVQNPVQFLAGDRLAFRTGALIGSYSDARVAAWMRENL